MGPRAAPTAVRYIPLVQVVIEKRTTHFELKGVRLEQTDLDVHVRDRIWLHVCVCVCVCVCVYARVHAGFQV